MRKLIEFIALWFIMMFCTIFMPILTLCRFEVKLRVIKKYKE